MNEAQNASTVATSTLGVWLQPKSLSPEWAPLDTILQKIIRDRVATTPWLPSGWLEDVEALWTSFPDQRVLMMPALGQTGKLNTGMPTWMDTEEKQKAWTDIAKEMANAVNLFAQERRDAGMDELNALYSSADWANRLYVVAKFIADAPSIVIGAAGDFASGIAGTFLKSFWPVLVLGAVVAVVYFNREKLTMAAGDRAAGIIKG